MKFRSDLLDVGPFGSCLLGFVEKSTPSYSPQDSCLVVSLPRRIEVRVVLVPAGVAVEWR